MDLIKLKCENCGANLQVNKELDKITCNFCGAQIYINDKASEIKRIEDAKLQARMQNHVQSLKERKEKFEQTLKEKKLIDEANSKEQFKKSKFSKVLLVFFALSAIFFFVNTRFTVKLLAFFQTLLFISAWLMGMEIIKEPKKGLRTILAIIAFVLIIPTLITFNNKPKVTRNYETINWNYIILRNHLPEPSNKKGIVSINSNNNLDVYISTKSEDEYREYIEACKEYGYTINEKYNTSSFEAENDEGYKLKIWYSDYSKEYNITLYMEKEDSSNSNNQNQNQNNNGNELRTNFKSAMDSYEKFIDEYLAFLKKYSNNTNDKSLISEYERYMKKYDNMVKDFEKWNSNNLNEAEEKYFLEVQTRVNKKLADAATSR